jgi:hypothetical protein
MGVGMSGLCCPLCLVAVVAAWLITIMVIAYV